MTRVYSIKQGVFIFLILLIAACDQTAITHQESLPDKASKYLQGIDVSHFQGQIDWAVVAEQDIQFAYLKATGGLDFVDPMFKDNTRAVNQTSLMNGAYHFFYANDDAIQQAKHFVHTVGSFSQKLPPVLDVEVTKNMDTQTLINGVLLWLKWVEQETGCQPIIYTNTDFGEHYLADTRLHRYPLWLAQYTTKEDDIKSQWWGKDWLIWQYSQTGEIAGVTGHVDRNHFNGSAIELNKLRCQ